MDDSKLYSKCCEAPVIFRHYQTQEMKDFEDPGIKRPYCLRCEELCTVLCKE